jgi:ribonuclease E
MTQSNPNGVPGDPARADAAETGAPAKRTRRRATKTTPEAASPAAGPPESAAGESAPATRTRSRAKAAKAAPAAGPPPALAAPVAEPGAEADAPRTRRRKKAAEAAAPPESGESAPGATETAETAHKTTRGRATKATKATKAAKSTGAVETSPPAPAPEEPAAPRRAVTQVAPPAAVFFVAPEPETPTSHTPAKTAAGPAKSTQGSVETAPGAAKTARGAAKTTRGPAKSTQGPTKSTQGPAKATRAAAPAAAAPPGEEETDAGRTRRRRGRRTAEPAEALPAVVEEADTDEDDDDDLDAAGRRRRRGRRGRGRGKGTADEMGDVDEPAAAGDGDDADDDDDGPLTRRRRRRRRRGAGDADSGGDEGVVTVVKIREPRAARDEVQGVTGSTRLEAKRQRRRDGREQRRTRPPILSESEFLARREAVDRVMVVRQRGDRTQIAVLEDGILVEHYVTRQSAATMVGNVYLGKVQNVLPSMEAAFVDIGRGRNAVLYAGEVNWDGSGLEGKARSIEQALKSGESVLVQVTKDPVGHKGARLTSHVALSGRHLVYVPNGHASGISRKLSDVERRRLRDVLKNLVPDGAGVIVRTAAEGAAEDDLARDVKRLQAQWEEIQARAADGGAPVLLSSEPDLVIRVARDLFNEDFRELVIQGSEAYDEVEAYLTQVSPDLVQRVRRHTGTGDAFGEFRVDEQILKALDRKVYLPSGGHLVIDRTEAMTVIDVNTGKYTGAGGNLEETVTRNNLEAAEEIVRQLRLRDVGGIIVIDFIDMVLESNRDLVLRRLTECLGRDRTKHQVTEITSLGLVQMTRKRIGQGLVEAFSEACEHCKGRGVIVHTEPVAERARSGVAEKVRAVAVAASSRSEPVEDAEPGYADDADEPAVIGGADTNGKVGGAGNGNGDGDDGEDAQASPGRRRARRGGTRRRTRP